MKFIQTLTLTLLSLIAYSNSFTNNKVESDSIILPDFNIELNLTKTTIEKLKSDEESIIIKAVITISEVYDSSNEITEFEEIFVIAKEIELWEPTTAEFKNIKISKSEFAYYSLSNFQVLINVYSGRHSIKSNILNCDSPTFNLKRNQNQTIIINGDLL